MIMNLELRTRVFIHRNIPYAFNWNISNHKMKVMELGAERQELRNLIKFLKIVSKGKIPNNTFNSRDIPRISQFKLRGIKQAYLSALSKKLIRSGKIKYLDENFRLSQYARKVHEVFKEKQKKPKHEPILKNILIKDKNSIAIEVPIWSKINNNWLTGHIDLLQIEGETIKVVDYKPEGKFIVSLPQVASYGLLVKRMFNLSKVTCVSFNKFEAWEFKPEILLNDVKEYLNSIKFKERIWEKYFELKE